MRSIQDISNMSGTLLSSPHLWNSTAPKVNIPVMENHLTLKLVALQIFLNKNLRNAHIQTRICLGHLTVDLNCQFKHVQTQGVRNILYRCLLPWHGN